MKAHNITISSFWNKLYWHDLQRVFLRYYCNDDYGRGF